MRVPPPRPPLLPLLQLQSQLQGGRAGASEQLRSTALASSITTLTNRQAAVGALLRVLEGRLLPATSPATTALRELVRHWQAASTPARPLPKGTVEVHLVRDAEPRALALPENTLVVSTGLVEKHGSEKQLRAALEKPLEVMASGEAAQSFEESVATLVLSPESPTPEEAERLFGRLWSQSECPPAEESTATEAAAGDEDPVRAYWKLRAAVMTPQRDDAALPISGKTALRLSVAILVAVLLLQVCG